MQNRIALAIISLVSFCLAVTLGMLDYETESLVHLFTAEAGNVVMIALVTAVFTFLGGFAWMSLSAACESAQ